MSFYTGSARKIEKHILKILNQKICSELNKLLDQHKDDIYNSVLEATFSNKRYEEEVYNMSLESVLATFDPSNNQVKILEGIDKALKKRGVANANITRKYNQKLKETKPASFSFFSRAVDKPIVLSSPKMAKDFGELKKRRLYLWEKIRENRATRKQGLSLSEKASILDISLQIAQKVIS